MEDRMHRHNMGHVKYTSTRLPILLIVFLSFPDEWKAVQMEHYFKSGSGRAFAKKHFY
jgi:predicted GIY-YIG superfamily endonuclease